MSSEKSTDRSKDRENLLKNDLKEGLAGLKELFVATISLIIKLSESFPKPSNSKSLSPFDRFNSQKKSETALSFVENSESENQSQAVNVSVEVEENKMSEKYITLINYVLYPILAILSTASIVSGVKKIEPLTKWAETQNACIEQTSINSENQSNNLANKVMTCNGGHAF